MGAILPTFKKVKAPPPELPPLTEEAKQAELAEFNGECVDEKQPGVDVCRKTQAIQEPGNVLVLETRCAGCDVFRRKEFRV